MNKISRFVFNFRNRCNMRCPYCYIPFIDPTPGDLTLWKAIVDKIATYNPDIVTFGGGDPFAQNGFMELLHHCKKHSFQVHVDTNAINLPLDRLAEIGQCIDIIGIPMDGNRQQHDLIRNYLGHYDTICKTLEGLERLAIPVKINTVYSQEHEHQLPQIAQKLKSYSNIRQWFIYEYWHFEGINAQNTTPPNVIFHTEISKLQSLSGINDIYYSSVKERSPAYIFVSSIGCLYTIGKNTNTYIELANIFDDDAEAVLSSLQNIEQIKRRAQLKQL